MACKMLRVGERASRRSMNIRFYEFFPPVGVPSFSFGFPKANDPVPVTVFNGVGAPSNFTRHLEFLHKNSSLGLVIPRTVYQKAPLVPICRTLMVQQIYQWIHESLNPSLIKYERQVSLQGAGPKS
ncbi:hypothetical protein NC652_007317 [Populus alba x Populus x berolinensis]|nr:hypothetical protein NC652_007317 [Populus alba x Populus x berolinensis]